LHGSWQKPSSVSLRQHDRAGLFYPRSEVEWDQTARGRETGTIKKIIVIASVAWRSSIFNQENRL
jgi:hypothetical protein